MDPWIVIGLLALALVLFATERISVDLITLGLLCALVLMGIVTPGQAFSGFSNEVIIMLGSIFVIGAAMRETGVLDTLGNLLARFMGGRPLRLVTVMMGGVGVISGFMNNTTVVAMFLGPVIGLARRIRMAPSRLLMPMAFASILGGTCTLIGTSTNVAVSGAFKQMGLDEVGMFEMTPIGIAVSIAGLLYMTTIGMRLVPDRDKAGAVDDEGNIREYLSEVEILSESPLIGQKAYSSDLVILQFQVVRILRGQHEVRLNARTTFEEGDVVLVAGKVENLMKVKKIEGIDIVEDVRLRESGVDVRKASVAEVVLTPRSSLVGKTLRGSNFRRRSGLSVLAILRGDRTFKDHMADVVLHAGDLLLLQGPYDRFRNYEENSEMVVITEHEFHPTARKRGLAVLVAFALAIIVSTYGLIPTSIAFLLVALFSLAARCLTLDMAYDNIDWRLLILIGGMTAFGVAMSNSGADKILADAVVRALEPLGAMAVLAGFCVLTIILTQPMSNAAAALVVLPVAIQAARAMDVSERCFGMAIMLSASISVLTPFEPSCILIFGPGKYRFSDFLKAGGGLTLVVLIVILALVPVFWPLNG